MTDRDGFDRTPGEEQQRKLVHTNSYRLLFQMGGGRPYPKQERNECCYSTQQSVRQVPTTY
jgi:hypothetical protein